MTFKRLSIIHLSIFFLTNCLYATKAYDQFFNSTTMRVDYFHIGSKTQEMFSIDQIYEEGEWPGSKINLIDTLNLGEYLLKVYDVTTNQLIFSRGYSTIFNEWQTTDEATSGIYKTYHETVRFPFPKRKFQLTINRRDKQMFFKEIYSQVIDPTNNVTVNRASKKYDFKVTQLMNNGPSSEKVDIVIIGDGYRKEDIQKFRSDAKTLNDKIFNTSLFKERKKDFNVWTIEVISPDSGIDKPDANVWKNTVLNSTYNYFGSARYVLTDDNKTLRDVVAAVPYDFINILVNDNRYGGGGIYNLYTTTYTINDAPGKEWQIEYVYVHEFGHSFGGLGDEYYSSQVSYTDFYTKGIEPWEPNVTSQINRDKLKWRNLVKSDTPLPTPWEKVEYDSLERVRAKLDRLAPDYYEKREPLIKRSQEILKNTKYAGQVGAFEGAGYISEGLYRPSADCRMFTLSLVDFDAVCRASIEKMIDFYSR
ncbi:MAG: IgA Peptidase M64 [Bacteroidetes bacterium]|nr:IgA Peptidase M64 [Bacteroidota bacterium]MBU1422329.1 IgA Peptidase M64 [Bacteroidota bacterium]